MHSGRLCTCARSMHFRAIVLMFIAVRVTNEALLSRTLSNGGSAAVKWSPMAPGLRLGLEPVGESANLTLRLVGGMGRKTTVADRYVKKRKAFEEKDGREKAAMQAEEDELAEEYAFAPDEDVADQAVTEGRDESVSTKTAADNHDEELVLEERGAADVVMQEADEEMNNGTMEARAGAHSLRTVWCSGDAWAGLFFDLEAREQTVTVRALGLASHIYRRERHVCVNIFVRNSSGYDHEGDALGWERIFSVTNCSLPMVGKRTEGESDCPYAQCVLDAPVTIAPGCSVGFAIYTNSLCGLVLRWPSSAFNRQPKSPDDLDWLGLKIGNSSTPIVAEAQEARRNVQGGVTLREITDSDEHIKIRAGYCSPVTGHDHPFQEENLDRVPENVRAFVGEVVYDLEPAPTAAHDAATAAADGDGNEEPEAKPADAEERRQKKTKAAGEPKLKKKKKKERSKGER